jgi:para-nitrobenzyl esterase
MRTARRLAGVVVAAGLALGCLGEAPQAARGPDALAGTSWRLVRMRFIDSIEIAPQDRPKYTITFGADGAVVLRIDCNRGRGSWRAAESGALELGPLMTTRVACPPGSHQDDFARAISEVREYELRGGALTLRGDTGSLDWEPFEP